MSAMGEIEKTPVYIDGELIGKCHRVRNSQDNTALDADYAYHIEKFEPFRNPAKNISQDIYDWIVDNFDETAEDEIFPIIKNGFAKDLYPDVIAEECVSAMKTGILNVISTFNESANNSGKEVNK